MDVRSVIETEPNPNVAKFKSGDTVKVYYRIMESGKERTQVFNGVVIRTRRSGPNSTFTVRQVFEGIGVERIFPYCSPFLEKVEVTAIGHARRAKLYYLRGLSKKRARLKLKST